MSEEQDIIAGLRFDLAVVTRERDECYRIGGAMENMGEAMTRLLEAHQGALAKAKEALSDFRNQRMQVQLGVPLKVEEALFAINQLEEKK